MALSSEQQLELQTQLQRAVVECSERCLYFAAKWYAPGPWSLKQQTLLTN
jgi:anaphase-promoting complex subunit 8